MILGCSALRRAVCRCALEQHHDLAARAERVRGAVGTSDEPRWRRECRTRGRPRAGGPPLVQMVYLNGGASPLAPSWTIPSRHLLPADGRQRVWAARRGAHHGRLVAAPRMGCAPTESVPCDVGRFLWCHRLPTDGQGQLSPRRRATAAWPTCGRLVARPPRVVVARPMMSPPATRMSTPLVHPSHAQAPPPRPLPGHQPLSSTVRAARPSCRGLSRWGPAAMRPAAADVHDLSVIFTPSSSLSARLLVACKEKGVL